MKERKFLNKKNIVIALVSCLLIGASATGVTIFLSDRGEAEAFEQQEQYLPVTGSDTENSNQVGDNSTADGENAAGEIDPMTPNEGEGDTSESLDTETASEETTGMATEGTTTEEILEGIEETVIERERKIYEDLQLSWTTIALSSISTNMGVYKPELQIEKTATDLIRVDNPEETIEINSENKPMVRPGDLIIYTIEVSNVGNYKATNVVVTDSLDVIFDEKNVKAGEALVTIPTLDFGKVAKLKVGYIVTQEDVSATEITENEGIEIEVSKDIVNIAYATDGKTTVEDDENMPVNPDIESIVGTKTWVDNNNSYNTRPQSITINLLADGEKVAEQVVTPNQEGVWEYTFTNFPKYNEEKEEIEYTITENELEYYTYEVEEGTYNITNTILQEEIDIGGTKTWEGPDGTALPEGTRLPEVTIELYRDNETEAILTTQVKEDGTYIFDKLAKYDLTDGHMYTYRVEEVVPDGYKSVKDEYNFTNIKLVPDIDIIKEIKEIKANGKNIEITEKVAQDSTITYTIIATNTGNTELENFTVTDNRDVILKSVELPKSLTEQGVVIKTGDEIKAGENLLGRDDLTVQSKESIIFTVTYTLQKEDVTKEDKTFINEAAAYGTYNEETIDDDDKAEIETEYISEKTNKTFEKKWNEADVNYESLRPTSIEVQLMNGDTKVGDPVQVTEANNWRYTWYDLPLEDSYGNTINYTVIETEIDGYTASECTIDENGNLTITNTYNKPTGGNITKSWVQGSQTEAPVPVDVVFVLDTSLSMIANESPRAQNLVTAVNNAISQILSYNSNNRVSVVGFSEDGIYGEYHDNGSDASVLLELGRYEVKDTSNNKSYLVKDSNTVKTNVKKETINSNNEITYETYATRTRYFEQATYTQAGIRLGAEQLINVPTSDTTVQIDEYTTVKRVPVMIIVSDGEPTAFSTDYDNPDMNSLPNAEKLGSGQLPNTTAVYGYYTILTANYYKQQISEQYDNSAKVFTIGMNIATYYGETVLDPNPTRVLACASKTEGTAYNGATNTINNLNISKDLYEYLNLTEDLTVQYSKVHESYLSPSKTTTAIANPYTSYSYADEAFSGTMDADSLQQAMIGSITSNIPQTTSWTISTDDLKNGKTYLPSIKISGAFSLVAGTCSYSNCQEAIDDGVIKSDDNGYYIDLTKIPAGENLTVSYTQL